MRNSADAELRAIGIELLGSIVIVQGYCWKQEEWGDFLTGFNREQTRSNRANPQVRAGAWVRSILEHKDLSMVRFAGGAPEAPVGIEGVFKFIEERTTLDRS